MSRLLESQFEICYFRIPVGNVRPLFWQGIVYAMFSHNELGVLLGVFGTVAFLAYSTVLRHHISRCTPDIECTRIFIVYK